jgi:hypothetical protein
MPANWREFTRLRQAHGHLAERVARRVEHVVAEGEQPAQLAARHVAGDVDRPRRRAQRDPDARCVERIGRRGERGRLVAEHERLARADEDVQRTVVLGHRADGYPGRQLVDQQVALVEQVVRRLPRATHRSDDLLVEVGDRGRERVHLVHRGADALVQFPGEPRELAVVV